MSLVYTGLPFQPDKEVGASQRKDVGGKGGGGEGGLFGRRVSVLLWFLLYMKVGVCFLLSKPQLPNYARLNSCAEVISSAQ